MSEPGGIGRRLVEIVDAALCLSAGVDGEMRAPEEPFIRPDRAKCVSLGKGQALGDRQFDLVGHFTPPRWPRTRPELRPKISLPDGEKQGENRFRDEGLA